MRYTTLGSTGMSVSRLCLGCMSYGTPDWRPWVLSEEDARPFFRRAIEAGINKTCSGVNEKAKTAKARLSFHACHHVVGNTNALECASQCKLAGVQHECIAVGNFHQLGKRRHIFFNVNHTCGVITKHPK